MIPLEEQIKEQARQLGFDLVGVTSPSTPHGIERFQQWLDQGFAGQMHYMHRNAQARSDPSSILQNVRTLVMVGINHAVDAMGEREERRGSESLQGRVARYAWSSDYHDILRKKLKQLLAWIQSQIPECHGRAIVDTAPLLERDFARKAGLGWYGKNTMLLNKHFGSYFFIGALLLDIELNEDPPFSTSHCGSCTACLTACPTDAFPEPGMLDARKCISYLTIELRDAIPLPLRTEIGEWLFGCDICQEVCPWNRKAPGNRDQEMKPKPDLMSLDLLEVLKMSEEDFQSRFAGTALSRPGRSGLIRNAAIVLGNLGRDEAIPALQQAATDPDPLIREAAEWAISQIEAKS